MSSDLPLAYTALLSFFSALLQVFHFNIYLHVRERRLLSFVFCVKQHLVASLYPVEGHPRMTLRVAEQTLGWDFLILVCDIIFRWLAIPNIYFITSRLSLPRVNISPTLPALLMHEEFSCVQFVHHFITPNDLSHPSTPRAVGDREGLSASGGNGTN